MNHRPAQPKPVAPRRTRDRAEGLRRLLADLGYRLLCDGERTKKGDEWLSPPLTSYGEARWVRLHEVTTFRERKHCPMRRKAVEPKPARWAGKEQA